MDHGGTLAAADFDESFSTKQGHGALGGADGDVVGDGELGDGRELSAGRESVLDGVSEFDGDLLVEPMFADLLITLLNFEAVILAHGVGPDHDWWQRLKHVLLASTLAMNVIPQITPLLRRQWAEFNVGSLAVHAIIPVIVYGLAEVIPVIQARTRQVILHGYELADQHEHNTRTPERDRERGQASEAEPKSEPPSPVIRRAPKLPATMLTTIKQARDQAAAEGRPFTADDVRQAVKVPDGMAEQIAAEFATTNGHALV